MGQKVKCKDLSILGLVEVDFLILRRILEGIIVIGSREQDEIKWCGEKSG